MHERVLGASAAIDVRLFPSSLVDRTIAPNSQDGFILASALSRSGMDAVHLPAALNIFDDIRCPFAQGVQRASSGN